MRTAISRWRRDSGEEQASDVGAGAQQHQAEQRQQDRRDEQRFLPAAKFPDLQRHQPGRLPHAPVVLRVRLLELLAERVDGRLRLLARRARRETAEHAKGIAVVAVANRRQHQGAERYIKVRRVSRADRPVRLGQHADDVEGRVVQRQSLADDGRVLVEAQSPEPEAEHRQARLRLGGGFRRSERPSDGHGDAKHLEEVRRHREAVDALHLFATAQVQRHPPEARDRFENAALLQIAKVQVGELVAVAGLDAHDPAGIGHRGRVEKDGANRREEREVDAQPQAE